MLEGMRKRVINLWGGSCEYIRRLKAYKGMLIRSLEERNR